MRTTAVLQEAGFHVRGFVRRPTPKLDELGIPVALGDMRDDAALRTAVAGCNGVVHLAAAKQDEEESDDVNVGGARRLVDACRRAGCRRLVIVSTQSTKIGRQGTYARTKAAADAVFRNSGLDVTILVPSIIYGESLEGIFGTLHKSIVKLPFVPVLGDGRWRSAPVYVGDVAEAIAACLVTPATCGRDYDIAGHESLDFNHLLDKIGVACGRGSRRKLHVPFILALLAARCLALLLSRPPITVSNVLGSNQDTAIDIAPARRDFGFSPIPLDVGLRRVFPERMDAEATLRAEARHFSRYLLGVDVTEEIATRYAAAHQRLFTEPVDRVTQFTRRYPSTIAFLDAAMSLTRTRQGLRKRILLMTAIMEASSIYADWFLPRRRSLASSAVRIGWAGVRAAGRAIIGVPLYIVLRDR
jgi:NADH dehydrogenase